MSNCYYHSDAPSTATCIQCGMPICSSCTNMVGPKAACGKCADNVRSRFGDSLTSQATTAAPTAASPYYSKPAKAAISIDAGDTGRMIGALALGMVVAAIGACVLEYITNLTHFYIGYAYALVGWGVGLTVGAIANRGGAGMAVGACVVMVVGLAIGEFILASVTGSITINPIGLLFVLIGLSACFKIVNSAG